MLPDAEIDRFLRDLAALCARHGVTVVGTFDGKTQAIMRGQAVALEDGRLDRELAEALRAEDLRGGSPQTFFS